MGVQRCLTVLNVDRQGDSAWNACNDKKFSGGDDEKGGVSSKGTNAKILPIKAIEGNWTT